MAAKRTGGLGRGLEALFEVTSITDEVEVDVVSDENKIKKIASDVVHYIDINDIKPNLTQPRKQFDETKISDLAESIKTHGMIQPIIIRPLSSGSGYEIVAGERRWRAARVAELREIPCIIRELSDRENMLIAIIENTQREDLNPIEEAMAFREMMSRYELTQAEVSKSIGKSRPYITNSLRLLKLPDVVQNLVIQGRLSGGHARAIAGVDDEKLQIRLAELAKDGGLSVRALEKMIADAAENAEKKEPEKPQRIVRSVAPGGAPELEKELLAIFERTYGQIKRRDVLPMMALRSQDKKELLARMEPAEEFVLVDGYNIIFAWDELKEIGRDSLDAARHVLMNLLCNYQGYRGCNLILVFDAYKVPQNLGMVEKYHNIFIVYTQEAETADSYIERVTYELRGRKRVRVATSDNLEQLIILGHGAVRVSAKSFHDEVMQTQQEIERILAQNNQKNQ